MFSVFVNLLMLAGPLYMLQIYDRVANQPVRHAIDKKILLHSFFRPETFSLLKWAAYGGF